MIDKWARKFDSVSTWLSKLSKKKDSAMGLYYFCYWAEANPEELLALKDDRSSMEAEKLLDRFTADEDAGLTDSEKYISVIAVRSFFKHNYRDLARAAGAEAFTYQPGAQYKPSKEDLRKLYRHCYNPRDRSMLTFTCSTGIAKGTLSGTTWEHLEPSWEDTDIPHVSIGPELLKGKGRGKYRGMRQETFLTPEAKRDLLEYREWIEKKMGRSVTEGMNIYLEIKEPFRPLSYDRIGGVFDGMAERAGVPFSMHDARRYVQTTLEECRIPPNWARKIRGRKVRGEEAPYSRPAIEKLREFYMEAAPKLEFVSETSAARTDVQMRRKMAWELLKAAGFNPDELLRKARLKRPLTPQDEVHVLTRAFGRLVKRRPEGKRQAIVKEEELENHLSHGWRFVAALGNGKCVVSREE